MVHFPSVCLTGMNVPHPQPLCCPPGHWVGTSLPTASAYEMDHKTIKVNEKPLTDLHEHWMRPYVLSNRLESSQTDANLTNN